MLGNEHGEKVPSVSGSVGALAGWAACRTCAADAVIHKTWLLAATPRQRKRGVLRRATQPPPSATVRSVDLRGVDGRNHCVLPFAVRSASWLMRSIKLAALFRIPQFAALPSGKVLGAPRLGELHLCQSEPLSDLSEMVWGHVAHIYTTRYV